MEFDPELKRLTLIYHDQNSLENVRVKLSADCAKVSGNTNFIIQSISFLDGSDNLSHEATNTVAIIEGSESYDNLKSFNNIHEKINNIIKNGGKF